MKFKKMTIVLIAFLTGVNSSLLWAQEDSFESFDEIVDSEEEGFEESFEGATDVEGDSLLEDGEILDQLEELNKFSEEEMGLKPFVYAERGRKNPFQRPSGVRTEITEEEKDKRKTSGLEGYDLESFEVTAVLWDIKFPKALVKSPNSEIYQIEEGTKIGRNSGYVAKIREGEVVVVESSMPNGEAGRKFYKTQVLKLGR